MKLIEPKITSDRNDGCGILCECGNDIWVNIDETKTCYICGRKYYSTYLIFTCNDDELCFFDRVKRMVNDDRK